MVERSLFRIHLSSVSNNFNGCRGTAKHWKVRGRSEDRGRLSCVIFEAEGSVSKLVFDDSVLMVLGAHWHSSPLSAAGEMGCQ
jgi:hypothetical protein